MLTDTSGCRRVKMQPEPNAFLNEKAASGYKHVNWLTANKWMYLQRHGDSLAAWTPPMCPGARSWTPSYSSSVRVGRQFLA